MLGLRTVTRFRLRTSLIARHLASASALEGNVTLTCLCRAASTYQSPAARCHQSARGTSGRGTTQRRCASYPSATPQHAIGDMRGSEHLPWSDLAGPRPVAGDGTVAVEATAAAAASPKRGGAKQRMRLDEYCMQLAPQYSRNVIQSFILQGKVRVGDKVVTKAGTPVVVSGPTAAAVFIDAEEPRYVCRAGLKLEKALAHWDIDVRGLTALDSGQSTGGFTDCLLQHGAAKVYGIDVGFNQLADKIRRDERVVVMEKFNLRHLEPRHLPCKVDIATLDLSFISVLLVVGAVSRVLRPDGGRLVVLIKPQFEAGRKQVRTGGVVRDPKVHAEVLERVTRGIMAHGYELLGTTESPIKGDKSGNIEFLAYFLRRPELAAAAEASAAEAAAEALAAEAAADTGAAV